MGDQEFGIETKMLVHYAKQIKSIVEEGVETAIVIGGGNIYRGLNAVASGIERVTGDYMGMMATCINGMALQAALEKEGVYTRLVSALEMDKIAEPYIRRRATRHLEKGRVVIFDGGTGNPFFTTDTASALRASEINAEIMLMAKNKVNGVYDKDPRKHDNARKFDYISYDDIIKKGLKVIDTAAISLCKNNNIPVIVFDFADKNSIEKILKGEMEGTFIGEKNYAC